MGDSGMVGLVIGMVSALPLLVFIGTILALARFGKAESGGIDAASIRRARLIVTVGVALLLLTVGLATYVQVQYMFPRLPLGMGFLLGIEIFVIVRVIMRLRQRGRGWL